MPVAIGTEGKDPRPPALSPARVEWLQGQPVSQDLQLAYTSPEKSCEKANQVFVVQNRLPERFGSLEAAESFVVAEAGFGAGLNFLLTWQAWLAAAPPDGAVLHFVSIEPQPLSLADLRQACRLWPELAALSEQLLDNYPALTSGLHRIAFANGQVRLSLFFGPPLNALQNLTFTADAWFLDRFAADRDPELWSRPVVQAMATHCRNTTTATVRDSTDQVGRFLSDAGFTMSKIPVVAGQDAILAGGFTRTGYGNLTEQSDAQGDTVIIGAGIAGALLARNLAERGRSVTVMDAGTASAAGASGNRQGALYVKLGVDFNQQSELALSALLHSQRFYAASCPGQWHPTGLLQMTWSEHEADRQRRFQARNNYPRELVRPVDKTEASELAGTEVPAGGLWYPNCGWLEPENLCRHLLDHPRIQVRFGFRVTRFMPCNGRWYLSGTSSPAVSCDRIVFCTGHETPELISAFGEFRLKPIRGQVTSLPESEIKAPKAVICGSRYLNPAFEGQCLTGATFDLHDSSPWLSPQSHGENLQQLQDNIPNIWANRMPAADNLGGRVAFRCTTHDYQPVAGPLRDRRGNELDSVGVFTGLGSKGLAYAPLLAEYLADRMTGQPHALPKSLAQRLAPERCRRVSKAFSA
ncbi:MAG: FAD-dependent 5-carboxymethylaminomethyl-2-thiouridine(34) oxidoreductase MnmC [Oleiphilaceae bacterium]|nr:FAD-dependent 5-carboxymethylaminomethyl-2-thiouridine(34) oxidoreductase MnmC [Oleiphilaceae bacterium]